MFIVNNDANMHETTKIIDGTAENAGDDDDDDDDVAAAAIFLVMVFRLRTEDFRLTILLLLLPSSLRLRLLLLVVQFLLVWPVEVVMFVRSFVLFVYSK